MQKMRPFHKCQTIFHRLHHWKDLLFENAYHIAVSTSLKKTSITNYVCAKTLITILTSENQNKWKYNNIAFLVLKPFSQTL